MHSGNNRNDTRNSDISGDRTYNRAAAVLIDSLEARVLMHGGHGHFDGGGNVALGDLGLAGLGGCGAAGVGIFMPASPNATVTADLTKLQQDKTTLRTDIKALSSTDKTTLRTDEQAIRDAIKALDATLSPLQTTLRTDCNTWRATIATDLKTIRQDTKNGVDTTADQAKLKADQAAGLTAIKADQAAIQSAIDGNAAVQAARTKLATDLPTIAADEAALKTDSSTLVTDVLAQLNGA